ncbi:MAG: family 43 glycosylhydrolase [Clostridia bacterium]|nr:family 43 glycosylhydrolase [Clostridia bacterium]
MKFSNLNISVKDLKKAIPAELSVKKNEKLACRDPFILLYGDKYYLYRSAGAAGIQCCVSDDLENWSTPITVFTPPADFHGVKDFFWAPECHYYKGNFYIFTSVFSSVSNHRNVSVYRADNPLGPFEDIANGSVTPSEWDTIDGTLYVDGKGQPWLVFVHEWTSMPDKNGSMAIAKLSDDLTHLVSEPVDIFRARDKEWATHGVTDGPYLYRTEEGRLLMIWSNFSKNGYVIAKVYSESGEIEGPWKHEDEFLYAKGLKPTYTVDGGHGMIFQKKDGTTVLSFHGPNAKQSNGDFEHLILKTIVEIDGTIRLAD